LDFLGGAARPDRDDVDLDVGDVGIGFDGQAVIRDDAAHGEQEGQRERDEALVERERNETRDHADSPPVWGCASREIRDDGQAAGGTSAREARASRQTPGRQVGGSGRDDGLARRSSRMGRSSSIAITRATTASTGTRLARRASSACSASAGLKVAWRRYAWKSEPSRSSSSTATDKSTKRKASANTARNRHRRRQAR